MAILGGVYFLHFWPENSEWLKMHFSGYKGEKISEYSHIEVFLKFSTPSLIDHLDIKMGNLKKIIVFDQFWVHMGTFKFRNFRRYICTEIKYVSQNRGYMYGRHMHAVKSKIKVVWSINSWKS